MNPAILCMLQKKKVTSWHYFSYFIHLATFRQITFETLGGIIMHVNLFNKTIIYKRIVGNLLLYILPKT